jgi:hypothetical protein
LSFWQETKQNQTGQNLACAASTYPFEVASSFRRFSRDVCSVLTFQLLQEILLHVSPANSTAANAPVSSPSIPFPWATIQLSASAPTIQPSSAPIPLPLLHTPSPRPLSNSNIIKPQKLADYHVLVLGNGTRLTFTAAQIPDPPATSFANNIPGPRLNSRSTGEVQVFGVKAVEGTEGEVFRVEGKLRLRPDARRADGIP